MTLPLASAIAALVIAVGTWVLYLMSIARGTVPARPVGSIIAQLAAAGLAVLALVWGVRDGEVTMAAIAPPAGLAMTAAALFLWLLTQRKTPVGELAVAVGDTLIPFEACSADGAAFHTDSLAGQRVLLKFFRGHW